MPAKLSAQPSTRATPEPRPVYFEEYVALYGFANPSDPYPRASIERAVARLDDSTWSQYVVDRAMERYEVDSW